MGAGGWDSTSLCLRFRVLDSGASVPVAVLLQVQEERILHQQVKCIITEEKVCMVCKKKIGNR